MSGGTNQTAVTSIKARPVQGRQVDPFRGTPDDGPQRLASRDSDSQPFDAVLAAIEAITFVGVKRTGRRLAVRRAEERLKVAFVSAGPRVSLDDLVIEGDGRLALAVMHALLPLFGPVEIRIGRFEDLLDGHEPLATVVERFDAWFIEDSLHVAKKLAARGAQEAAKVGAGVAEPYPIARRMSGPALAIVGLALIALAVGAPWLWSMARDHRRDAGETCAKSDDCASNQCLPREPMRQMVVNGIPLSALDRPPTDLRGVCTHHCVTDDDCPASMACRELASVGQLGTSGTVFGCVPRAWHTDSEQPLAP